MEEEKIQRIKNNIHRKVVRKIDRMMEDTNNTDVKAHLTNLKFYLASFIK